MRDYSVCGLTCYTAGISLVVEAFDLNPDNSKSYLPIGPIAGFSVYIFGIFFAPIVTPHIVERTGRSIVYLVCLPLCGIFLLGCKFPITAVSLEEMKILILTSSSWTRPIPPSPFGSPLLRWSLRRTLHRQYRRHIRRHLERPNYKHILRLPRHCTIHRCWDGTTDRRISDTSNQ